MTEEFHFSDIGRFCPVCPQLRPAVPGVLPGRPEGRPCPRPAPVREESAVDSAAALDQWPYPLP